MNRVEALVRRIDRFQQAHVVLGFPFAVLQKSGNDRAGALAARMAYHGLFSLFPLLLLLTTILDLVLQGNSHLRHQVMNSALGHFPVIGDQLRKNTHSLGGSGVGLAVGIAGTIYGTFGLAQSSEAAMNTVWNIPYVKWPSYVFRRLRGLALFGVLGLAVLVSGAMATFAGQISGLYQPLSYAGSVLIDFAVFMAVFLVLTAESLRWREVLVGVALATIFYQVLLAVGTWYMGHEIRHFSSTYGFFAVVIALLSWMYLIAQLTLMAAEINVVLKYRLWPRSITQPPLTGADRLTFARLAAMQTRRPEYDVGVLFKPSADHDPLEKGEGLGDRDEAA